MQQHFGTVQEFLQSEKITGKVKPVQLGGFSGELSKGVVQDRELRDLTGEDLERGIKPDTLIIALLDNPQSHGNYIKLENPPERTGKFAAFMDEAEDAASLAGYLYVRAEKVMSGFLPEKLEARGYDRVPRDDGNSHPDYLKVLRQPS